MTDLNQFKFDNIHLKMGLIIELDSKDHDFIYISKLSRDNHVVAECKNCKILSILHLKLDAKQRQIVTFIPLSSKDIKLSKFSCQEIIIKNLLE